MESSFSKLVYILVRKFFVLRSPGASKVIQSNNKHTEWHFRIYRMFSQKLSYLSPQQLCEVGKRGFFRGQRGWESHSKSAMIPCPWCFSPTSIAPSCSQRQWLACKAKQRVWGSSPGLGPWDSEPCCSLLCIKKGPSSRLCLPPKPECSWQRTETWKSKDQSSQSQD